MDSSQNSQYKTFPNIFTLISVDPADLSHMQKIIFPQKNHEFLIENML